MTARPTPLVDAAMDRAITGNWVPVSFARDLERQLAEAREECERLRELVALHEASRVHAIESATDRFLGWKLPADFAPDSGISFAPFHPNGSTRFEPTGTNLLNAPQAEAMFEYCLAINRLPSRPTLHHGVDICEVAAAVEVIRSRDIVNDVSMMLSHWRECPFKSGFEQACEEIAHRLRHDSCGGTKNQDAAMTREVSENKDAPANPITEQPLPQPPQVTK